MKECLSLKKELEHERATSSQEKGELETLQSVPSAEGHALQVHMPRNSLSH